MGSAKISPRFIVDDSGQRIAVVLEVEEYERLLRASEELDDLRAYDRAKDTSDDVIPFDQAVREIESSRR